MAAKHPSTAKAEKARDGRAPVADGIRIDALAVSRLAACYGLLARAAFDLGIKAEESSKLSRALVDVAQARDTLAEIVGAVAAMPLAHKSTAALNAADVRSLVFTYQTNQARNWEYWRERERKKRRGEED